MMQKILAPISVGELWDKITILKIKQQHVQSESAAINILNELQQLEDLVPAHTDPQIMDLVEQLKQVNLNIWHAEEQIRQLYVRNDFNSEFCIRTQEILYNNDHRAHIKRRINEISQSDICEEKIYAHMAHTGIT
jgi:hypothetical protein